MLGPCACRAHGQSRVCDSCTSCGSGLPSSVKRLCGWFCAGSAARPVRRSARSGSRARRPSSRPRASSCCGTRSSRARAWRSSGSASRRSRRSPAWRSITGNSSKSRKTIGVVARVRISAAWAVPLGMTASRSASGRGKREEDERCRRERGQERPRSPQAPDGDRQGDTDSDRPDDQRRGSVEAGALQRLHAEDRAEEAEEDVVQDGRGARADEPDDEFDRESTRAGTKVTTRANRTMSPGVDPRTAKNSAFLPRMSKSGCASAKPDAARSCAPRTAGSRRRTCQATLSTPA